MIYDINERGTHLALRMQWLLQWWCLNKLKNVVVSVPCCSTYSAPHLHHCIWSSFDEPPTRNRDMVFVTFVTGGLYQDHYRCRGSWRWRCNYICTERVWRVCVYVCVGVCMCVWVCVCVYGCVWVCVGVVTMNQFFL